MTACSKRLSATMAATIFCVCAAIAPGEPALTVDDASLKGVRIVPQFAWDEYGTLSPDGRFAATTSTRRSQVLVVDIENHCVAWAVPLIRPKDVAFSPDGTVLAACGAVNGLVLDLQGDLLRYVPNLAGERIRFCNDGQSVLLIGAEFKSPPTSRPSENATAQQVKTLLRVDLQGNILQRFSLEMQYPETIEISERTKRITVKGLYGKVNHQQPSKSITGTCEQIIDLRQGVTLSVRKGPLVQGLPADYRSATPDRLPPPDKGTVFDQIWYSLHYDPATTTAVIHGPSSRGKLREFGILPLDLSRTRGRGWSVFAWRIRDGKYLGDVGSRYGLRIIKVFGFIDEGAFVCLGVKDNTIAFDILSTGSAAPFRFRYGPLERADPYCLQWPDAAICRATGRAALYIPDCPDWFEGVLSMIQMAGMCGFRSPRPAFTGPIELPSVSLHHAMMWEPRGNYLVRLCSTRRNERYVEIRSREGKLLKKIRLQNEHEARKLTSGIIVESPKKRSTPAEWITCFDIGAGGKKIMLGTARPAAIGGRAIVMDLETERVIAETKCTPGAVSACRLLDGESALLATSRSTIAMWDYRNGKVLWTVNVPDGGFTRIAYIGGRRYAICVGARCSWIIDIRAGKVVRASCCAPMFEPLPSWSNPILIGNGNAALEMQDGTLSLSLVETTTGKPYITFCVLPEGQWIAWTPRGHWDGSAGVQKWVRFYWGNTPLEPLEAAAFRNPAEIKHALDRAFGNAGITTGN